VPHSTPPPLTKDAVADILESIAQLRELKGENPFKIRAYLNAARAIQQFPGDIHAMARDNQLEEISGLGKSIAEKVHELLTTGEMKFYAELKAEFPPDIFELFELQGLGAKKIKVLYEDLGIHTIEALEKACRDGRVAALPHFGEKTAQNICAAIAAREKHAGEFRFGDVASDAGELAGDLREHPDVNHVAIAGSYRRRKEIVHDLDFIVSTKEPESVSEYFVHHPMVESILAQGPTKSSVRLKSGIQADLRVVKNSEYPFALTYFTGSKEHNIVLRSRALDHGWTLNEYRLAPVETKAKTKPKAIPPIHSEADLYRALDLDYIEPELREDRSEIAAAEKHALPDLIEQENLRGTFHNHTNESDGRNSLAEMAAAAQELGMQYLGIADHSKSSFQAHGLDEKRLLAQIEQIHAMNKTFDGFRLFAGVECDILKDGRLDFPDEILAQLDYVVVSVHAVFNLSEAEMTKRIIRAISDPHVTFLGHLTGRLLLTRDGYQVNVPAVIDACAETGTIIELNSNPYRLDMDWRWWPLATEKGVKCVINPDAHHTSHLQFLYFGVGIARKGWLTRDDVVNCLPLGKIEKVLEAKRQRRAK
jgi:DNA polymerase (family X)